MKSRNFDRTKRLSRSTRARIRKNKTKSIDNDNMSAALGYGLGLGCLRFHSLYVDGPTLFGHLESAGVVDASVDVKC